MTTNMMASPGSQYFPSVLPEKIPAVGGAGGVVIGRSDSFDHESGLHIGGGGGGLPLGMSVLGKQMIGGQNIMFGELISYY